MRVKSAWSPRESCSRIRVSFINDAHVKCAWILGCTKIAQICQNHFASWYNLVLYIGNPFLQNKLFLGIFLAWPPVSSFWPFKGRKCLKNGSKKMIFKNWLKTHTNVRNAHAKKTCNPPSWGVVGIKKWYPYFCFVIRSAISWHLKMGTFGTRYLPEAYKCPLKLNLYHSPFLYVL